MTNDYTATILAQAQQRDYHHQAEQHALAVLAQREERPRRTWRIRLPLHLFTIEIYRQSQPQPCVETA